MMRLQDRERLRQCARVVRPRALRRRRRPAGPAFSNATSSARRSAPPRRTGTRWAQVAARGRRIRAFPAFGGAGAYGSMLVCFELCMLCNSRFSACVAYMRLYVPDRTAARQIRSESRQMTPGHAFDFVSQIWTLVHVYDSGHARMTQCGDRLKSNMLT